MKDTWKDGCWKWLDGAVGNYVMSHMDDDGETGNSLLEDVHDARKSFSEAITKDLVKSPIEAALFAYLLFASDGYGYLEWNKEPNSWGSSFTTQKRIGKYTTDFLFTARYRDHVRYLIVECDGHQFHEKTAQQAQHDKSRDRALAETGAQVLRFTGAEIYRDPTKCVEEIEGHLSRILDEALIAGGAIKGRARA